jgi:hypothetical protein
MNTKLRPEPRSTEGKFAEPGNNTSSVEEHDNDLITRWFSDSAKAYGSGKEVAFALGCDPSFVTALKGGAKSVAGRYLVAMLRKPESAVSLLTDMITFSGRDVAVELITVLCKLTGLEPPKPKKRIDRSKVKQQLLFEIDRAPQVFELFVERIARSSGASEDEVRDAWSESTDIRELGR